MSRGTVNQSSHDASKNQVEKCQEREKIGNPRDLRFPLGGFMISRSWWIPGSNLLVRKRLFRASSYASSFANLISPWLISYILYFAPQWSQERLGNLTFCDSVTVVVNNERSQLTAGGPSVVLLLFLQDLPLIETFHCFASIPFPSLSSKGPLSTFINWISFPHFLLQLMMRKISLFCLAWPWTPVPCTHVYYSIHQW